MRENGNMHNEKVESEKKSWVYACGWETMFCLFEYCPSLWIIWNGSGWEIIPKTAVHNAVSQPEYCSYGYLSLFIPREIMINQISLDILYFKTSFNTSRGSVLLPYRY